MKKIDYYEFKFHKSNRTSKETRETTTNQCQYPTNTTWIGGHSTINGIHGERLSGKNDIVKFRNFTGAIRGYAA